MSSKRLKSRYQLKERLGTGGMGVVYRARDTVINADVALKTLADTADPMALRMFREECDKLAKIVHPNVVEIRDTGEIDENGRRKPYLVMPFLRGKTLDSLILDSGPLPLERAIEILIQASRGLQATHEAGLIHRDIKPSNIFVLDDDSVKLIDFGVAHYAETLLTGTRKGTLMYMAPEQVTMHGVSALSDIFSLGVVAYETLTGRRPFEGKTEKELADAIVHRNPPPASRFNQQLNSAVDRTLQKALAKLPEHRFQSAREFRDTLRKAVLNEPINIFDPVRIEPRVEQARSATANGDLELAGDILNQLELEGWVDDRLSEVKRNFESLRNQRTVSWLLAAARIRSEAQEYHLATKKVEEALRLEPQNAEALALRQEIERRRAESDADQRLATARQLAMNRDFTAAKEAVEQALEIWPNEPAALDLRFSIQQEEQEYSAALNEKRRATRQAERAMTHCDPEKALGAIRRALDLDHQAPEPGNTASDLLNLYNRIVSAWQDTQRCLEHARELQRSGDPDAALACCDEALVRLPENPALRALKLDIEEAQQEHTSHLIAATVQEVEAEPNLDRRIEIWKSASERFPQVEHFSSTYRAACRKREFAEWLAEKARAAEREQRPADALEAWNAVRSIHPAYPGLDAKIAGLKQEDGVGSDYERRHDLIYQIRNAIATSEFAGALHLIQSAASSLQSEPEFAELRAAAESGAEREKRAGHLLDDAAQLTTDHRYDEAIRKLEEASGLNVRAREIAAARNYVFIEQAQSLFDTDPARAEALLKQSLEFAPARDTAHKLLELLEERNRGERITETTHRIRGVEGTQPVRIPAPAAEEKAAEIPVVASVVALAEKTPGSIITPPSFSFDTRPGLLQLVRRHRVKGVAMAFLGGTVAAAIVLAVMFPRHDRHKGVQPALTPQGSTGSAVHPGASVPRPAVSASASTPSVAEAKVAQAVPTVNDEAPLGTAPAPIPLPPAIHIETDFQSGSVLLDDERAGALEGGQFSQNIAKGSHSISVLPAAGGRYNFAFTLGKDGEWTLSAPKSSGYGTPILVALSSVRTRIVCGRSGLLVKLDDRRPAACTPAGMELPAVSEGNHTVALSDGLRTLAVHTLTYETTPVLTALVTTGAQFGGLAIRGSEDTFDVAVNGYTSKRPAKAGHWRRLLKPGDYTIAISKPGFVANPSTLNVSVTPGSDTLEQVAFTPIPARARLRLISEPGTEVTLNGKPAGTVSESGTLDLGQLPIGSADLRLHHHGFIDSQQTLSLVAGENERTIFLQQLKARVTWSVDPANAQLTYGPIGNSIRHPLTGNLIELPAGTYDFEVSAPGHLTASSVVTVAAGETRNISLRLEPAYPVLRTVDAWPGWQAQSGWLVREKAGPTFHNLPEHVSRVAFSAQWDRQKTLVHWSAGPLTVVFRSTDLSRLVIFRITEHGIFWTAAVQGKRQEGRVPLNLAKNSEMIQADIRPGGIALTVNGNALPAVGPNLFAESKPLQFGFIVEQDQVVRLSDIRIAARMISN